MSLSSIHIVRNPNVYTVHIRYLFLILSGKKERKSRLKHDLSVSLTERFI